MNGNWQIFMIENNKPTYVEIRSLGTDLPKVSKESTFVETMNFLLKKGGVSKTLSSIIQEFENSIPLNIQLAKRTAEYVKANEATLKSPTLFDSFFRATEPILSGESFKRMRLNKKAFFTISNNKNNRSPEMYLKIQDLNEQKKFCNFDIDKYEKGIFNIRPYSLDSISWAVNDQHSMIVLVSTVDWNLNLNEKSDSEQFLYSNLWNKDVADFCFFDNPKLGPIGLFSIKGRDPGQLLDHLAQYGISQAKTDDDARFMLDFSRHQIYTNPIRVGFESKKGTTAQLEELLQLNIPIYHVDSLGEIIGSNRSQNNFTFFDDKRFSWNKVCQ
jgi:hypothetical protein